MIPVTRAYLPPLDEYISQLQTIWQGGYLTNNGPLSRQLAGDVANFLGITNLELVANGTLVMQLDFKALRFKSNNILYVVSV